MHAPWLSLCAHLHTHGLLLGTWNSMPWGQQLWLQSGLPRCKREYWLCDIWLMTTSLGLCFHIIKWRGQDVGG